MTTDPLNDPAPRWTTKSVIAAAGYAAGIGVAVAGLTYADSTNSAADAHRAEMQAAADKAQNDRLDKIEARQSKQDQMLFDIWVAVARGKAKDGEGE